MATGDTVPEWARQRGRYLTLDALSRASTALIVVDLQHAFLDGDTAFAELLRTTIVPRVNRLIAAGRASGMPVIFLRHTTGTMAPQALPAWQQRVSPGVAAMRATLVPGHPAHGVFGGLDCRPGDPMIDKYRYSAFAPPASALAGVLLDRAIDTLIVCGAATNVCCESTVRDAASAGYRPLVVADATAAMTAAEHDAALLNLAVIFSDVQTTDRTVALIEAAA